MRLLLDAHTLLWWLADDPALGPGARRLIADPSNEVLVSAATTWEISIKRTLGKLDAPAGIDEVLADEGFAEAPILAADGERAGSLAQHHRDPFDRMLVVQAARLDAAVVTRDPVFGQYGTRVIAADR
jgi:PIN domain nuclease of toxin-antitoxin system